MAWTMDRRRGRRRESKTDTAGSPQGASTAEGQEEESREGGVACSDGLKRRTEM